MNADPDDAPEKDPLTAAVIKVFYAVYNEMGFGFAESVYRRR